VHATPKCLRWAGILRKAPDRMMLVGRLAIVCVVLNHGESLSVWSNNMICHALGKNRGKITTKKRSIKLMISAATSSAYQKSEGNPGKTINQKQVK